LHSSRRAAGRGCYRGCEDAPTGLRSQHYRTGSTLETIRARGTITDMSPSESDQESALLARLRSMVLPERGGALSERFRARRWEEFYRRFPQLPDMSVIDLGGYAWNWVNVPVRPKAVLVVNLDKKPPADAPDWIETVRADACELPSEIFDRTFDLAYSNSLIEHVGGYSRRVSIAGAVNRLAEHHWVQTPSRYFPIEPHWVFPGFQFLPLRVRAEVSHYWPLSSPELRARQCDRNAAPVPTLGDIPRTVRWSYKVHSGSFVVIVAIWVEP